MAIRFLDGFSVSKLLLGSRPFQNAEDVVRARLLANLLVLTMPVAILNALFIQSAKRIPLFVSYACVPVCVCILVALVLRAARPKPLGLWYGALMEALFIEAAVLEVSIVTFIGLMLVPFVVTLVSGRKPAAFFLAVTGGFVFHLLFRGVIGLGETSAIASSLPVFPSDVIAYFALLLIVYASSCAIEKLALDLYDAYMTERSAAIREIDARAVKERLLETVFSAVPIPLFVKDGDFRYTLCSEAYFSFTGLDRDRVIGHRAAEFFPAELAASFDDADRRIAETGLFQCLSTQLTRSNGQIIDISILKTPLFNESHQVVGVVGVVLDETERLVRERKLESLLESNRGALALLGHDLRNPLGAFRDLVRSVGNDERIDPREFREILTELGKSLDSLYLLLDELLDWARSEGGIEAFDPKELPLSSVIENILTVSGLQASGKGVKLESRVSSGDTVYADARMLETLLRNLISNSVKFTPTGGSVVIASSRDADGTTVTIADTGIGMPASYILSLYDSGRIKQRRGTDGEPGTGLGLALCKRLAERHGGRLDIESADGLGSSFSVFLPRRD